MCGGFVGKTLSTVTDAIGLTNTKADSKGFDVEGADLEAKRKAQEEDKATREEVLAMGKWLDAKSCRAKKLTQMLGCAPSRVSQIKLFTRSCPKDQMKLIKGFMKAIENKENMTKRDGEGR